MLQQKDMLNNAFNVVENHGLGKLKQREERTLIKDVMSEDVLTIESSATLKQAGELIVDKKSSCLPVVDNKRLVGILSAVDFVKLSVSLLDNNQA